MLSLGPKWSSLTNKSLLNENKRPPDMLAGAFGYKKPQPVKKLAAVYSY